MKSGFLLKDRFFKFCKVTPKIRQFFMFSTLILNGNMKISSLNKTPYIQQANNIQLQKFDTGEENRIDVSLYNQKGLAVPFCGLVKGADYIEENCINFLRKIRESRRRKFDEYDIKEMLDSLRKEQDSTNKEGILKEVFLIESEEAGKTPPKDFIKRTLKLTAGRPEGERFAILEFAQYELNNATKPLEAFSNLNVEKQNKLVKILKDINDINEMPYSNPMTSVEQNLDSVYDLFRVLVYAEDDLSKLSGSAADKYKIDTYHMLRDDMEFFNNQSYPNEHIRNKVNATVKNIYEYFLDNIL